jgi:hypothetical protein
MREFPDLEIKMRHVPKYLFKYLKYLYEEMKEKVTSRRRNQFRTRMRSNWNLRSPAVLTAIGVTATLVLAVAVVMLLLRTGGAIAVSDNATLIGALVALGGVFTAQMVGIALDDRRTQRARELEAQRAHEAALQNYFEQVGTLLIEQPLRRASPGDNLSTVVRAQTLAVLEGLDPDRKRILLQFLSESGLILRDKPVVSLYAANLMDADLSGADLSEAWLSGTNLSGAKGITNEQLEQQAAYIHGAIMPDGTTHL